MSDVLGRRLLAASGVLAGLLALIFAAMLFAISDLRSASQGARQSQEIISASNSMETLALNLESSARGYVITRQESFLAPWKSNVAAFPARAAALERLVSAQPQELRIEHAIVGIRGLAPHYQIVLTQDGDVRYAIQKQLGKNDEANRRLRRQREYYEEADASA